ncbi:MAG: hypothetical protein IPK85_02125 [Gemmatimonadetes bacterium]|nr:hypothetical protein [Gemmatimonadota bacterium]
MWNQSSSTSFGALLQHIAQSNPQVFQAIMQMVSQRQQGTGGIGSLPPAQGGPMPAGGMWGQTGQRPTNPLPYAQRFNASPMPAASAQMPTSLDGGNTYSMSSGPKFYPPTGPKQYGPTQPSYTPPTGPKQWGTPQPYTAPTGPKYMPPTGPKVYGQTTPAQPPAFAPSQPKVYPQPAPMAGDGMSGLDWYAQQAGN